MAATLKRLYVGGIGPSITDAELKDRFGKFGKVDDVDIISRKDEQGNPIKTFAYLNISMSDTDLKKCMSVLNKTKWKGGVLQIEMAKESFLHRLAQERQAAKEKEKPQAANQSQNDMLQSFEKAGVTGFQMKAAVPGTEVPDHKNWVVSKFGRVLPVLHLKGNQQSKIMKYDPSKYCHNIKRLDDNSHEVVPVSLLTWHMEGGDDEISRKRRGEFPAYKSPAKKKVKAHTVLDSSKSNNTKQCAKVLKGTGKKTEKVLGSQQETGPPKMKNHETVRKRSMNSMSDEDCESEEELKATLERKEIAKPYIKPDEDNIEVVTDSFKLSYSTHWADEKTMMGRKSNCSTKDNDEYDSADTDEIITVAKSVKNCSSVGKQPKSDTLIKTLSTPLKKVNGKQISTSNHSPKDTQNLREATDKPESVSQSDLGTDSSDSFSDEEYESMMQNCYRMDLSIGDLEALAKHADISDNDNSDGNSDDDNDCDSADTDQIIAYSKRVQHDNDVMKTNGDPLHSEKLPALKKNLNNDQASKDNIVISSKQTPRDIGAKNLDSDSSDSYCEGKHKSMKQKCHLVDAAIVESSSADDLTVGGKEKPTRADNEMTDVNSLKKKKAVEPDDILASILEDYDSSSEQPKCKKKKTAPVQLPAFKGLGSLLSSAASNELKPTVCSAQTPAPTSDVILNSNPSTTEVNPSSPIVDDTKKVKLTTDCKGNKEHQDVQQQAKVFKKQLTKVKPKSSSSSSSSDESNSDKESSSDTSSAAEPRSSQNITVKKKTSSKAKQLQDNQKRLAAMEERRKERELQKKTIQGALLQLDSSTSKKSQHIVFNSESETESEKEEKATIAKRNTNNGKKEKQATAKLFESSGEESDDEEEKDDGGRFEIKAQFEGKSGEKLMQLQSRFGTDERFKMSSMFLENSSEDEEDTETLQKSQVDEEDNDLSVEKKKNLDILQSVLNINVESKPVSKDAAKAKKFKDLNAFQYDPTKEDHAVLETKTETEKKESKSERKKRRLEAEKLPEVSKDTYHEVTLDFKEVFGAATSEATEEPGTTWDQEEEPKKIETESTMSNEDFGFQKTEESAGFTFSFFETKTEDNVSQDEPYKIETIKPVKVPWQEDPRFLDSSSEEEEEENVTATAEVQTSTLSTMSNSIRFFFFVKDDERLRAGPKMFFRSSKTEEEQAFWEQRRDSLLEECRKKHKDAKRKIKSKQ